MMTLVIGTPDSGKSKIAEDICCRLSEGKEKYYIATMIPYGEEGKRRVEKHRLLREGKGFITIEKPTALHELIPQIEGSNCLVECMSNLVGNEMFSEENERQGEALAEYIVQSICALNDAALNLTVVTNVFDDDAPGYDDSTRAYAAMVKRVNELLISCADKIYEKTDGEWILIENT